MFGSRVVVEYLAHTSAGGHLITVDPTIRLGVRAVEALAGDPNIDAMVVGLDPLSPAMRTLVQVEGDKTAPTDEEAFSLLSEIGLPFKKK